MKNIIKKQIRKFWPTFHYYQTSFSQEGEDLVIDRLLNRKKNGFYVEVGAHHPFRFSNSFFFYRKGWHGICIDPLPGTKKIFNRFRPRDVALELGVSETHGDLNYFMFNEPALNTFDEKLATERNLSDGYRIIQKISIPTLPLSKILDTQIIPESGIDLLSVDVEGFDLQVLTSNDWGRFLPNIVIAEALSFDFENFLKDPVCNFLVNKNYFLYAKTGCSLIFIQKNVSL